ncbi:MAG TPA: hypothetical protein VMW19_16055 [Myxococcota bacterium]|nr:hypothetical protein [Myxococcota bacterium]
MSQGTSADPAFRRFVGALLVVTLLPVFTLPLLIGFDPAKAQAISAAWLLHFVGGPAHVASTAWFYADPVPHAYFAAHRTRYYLAPAALVVATLALTWAWPGVGIAYVGALYSLWLFWHYQKQNWGIVSISSRVACREPASREELVALQLAPVAGWLACVGAVPFTAGTPIYEHREALRQIGVGLYALVPVVLALAFWRRPALRRATPRLLFVALASAFFLPAFFLRGYAAFGGFALAHGLQYHVFMNYVARSASAGPATSIRSRPGLAVLVVAALGLGAVLVVGDSVAFLSRWNLMPFYAYAVALTMGTTMGHFVVDAGIWRLSDSFVRRYVGAAFPFLAAPGQAEPGRAPALDSRVPSATTR